MEHTRIGAHVGDARAGRVGGEVAGQVGEDVLRAVGDEVAEVVGIGEVVGGLRRSEGGFEGGNEAGLEAVGEVDFLHGLAGRAPGFGLVVGDGVFEAEDEFVEVVFELDIQAVGEGGHAGVIAVVPAHAVGEAFGAAEEEREPLAHVGIGVPTVDHPLIEAMYVVEGLAGDELEIAGLIEAHVREGEGDFLQMQGAAERFAGLHDGAGIGAGKGFPERLGEFVARDDVEAVGEVAGGFGQAREAGAREEDHVGVGEEQPAVARVGAADGDVAGVGFEGGEVGAPGEAGVQFGPHAEDPQAGARGGGEGVVDGFDEGGEVVGSVVVGEEDLVVGVVEDFGDAVQGDGGALVEVVAMRVVAPVEDDRNHGLWSCGDRPKSIAHGVG